MDKTLNIKVNVSPRHIGGLRLKVDQRYIDVLRDIADNLESMNAINSDDDIPLQKSVPPMPKCKPAKDHSLRPPVPGPTPELPTRRMWE